MIGVCLPQCGVVVTCVCILQVCTVTVCLPPCDMMINDSLTENKNIYRQTVFVYIAYIKT